MRFGPRELDLDILMYGAEIVRTDRLTIPHPRMLERAFVLRPLADIAGDWRHPETGGCIAGIARGLDESGIRATNLRLDDERQGPDRAVVEEERQRGGEGP